MAHGRNCAVYLSASASKGHLWALSDVQKCSCSWAPGEYLVWGDSCLWPRKLNSFVWRLPWQQSAKRFIVCLSCCFCKVNLCQNWRVYTSTIHKIVHNSLQMHMKIRMPSQSAGLCTFSSCCFRSLCFFSFKAAAEARPKSANFVKGSCVKHKPPAWGLTVSCLLRFPSYETTKCYAQPAHSCWAPVAPLLLKSNVSEVCNFFRNVASSLWPPSGALRCTLQRGKLLAFWDGGLKSCFQK